MPVTTEIVVSEGSWDILESTLKELPFLMPKVLRRAINRTVRHINSQMVKTGAKALGIKQKIIRQRVWKSTARRSLRGRVRAGAVGWPVSLLAPKHRKAGVSVRLGGRRQVLEGTFLARMKSGHDDVYRRKGRARLPIAIVRTRSLTLALESAGLTDELVRDGQAFLGGQLEDAADYYVMSFWRRKARKGDSLAARRLTSLGYDLDELGIT